MTYYLAIDIGASNGRHILGYIENKKLVLEEIYRFDNNLTQTEQGLVWDIENLFEEILCGLEKCSELKKIPKTVAIDTWGVDYVLLDKNKKEILPSFCYRDSRTNFVQDEISKIISDRALYEKTGIQKQNFNTVYQLYCDKKSGKLENAAHFLMMPEYLSFKLTGTIKNEYTNATTTNLISANEKNWDKEILNALGINPDIFKTPFFAGESLGGFKEEVLKRVGFNANVVFCPSHDTAAAVTSCPVGDNGVYISSGTWSLIGIESQKPIISNEAFESNWTNEGGINCRFRFLKNIMGMWLFQNIRRNLKSEGQNLSYDEMMNLAKESSFDRKINPNDPSFVAPENMINAVREYLSEPNLALQDVLSSVYHSLAFSYLKAVEEIEKITGKKIDTVCIMGGGSQDTYLNELTEKYTGRKVITGAVEATAAGNILSQYMSDSGASLSMAREIIRNLV